MNRGGFEMIDVKEAVESATSFAKYINEDKELESLRVEEVEIYEDDQTWLVKLGWDDPRLVDAKPPSAQLTNLSGQIPRIYKMFYVDAETGEVKKMKKVT